MHTVWTLITNRGVLIGAAIVILFVAGITLNLAGVLGFLSEMKKLEPRKKP